MATVTKTFNESGSGNSTWTVSLTCPNVTATGSSFNTPVPSSCTAKFVKGTNNRNYAEVHIGDVLQLQLHGDSGYATLTSGEFYRNPASATSGTTYTLTRSGFSAKAIATADVFSSNNKTVRSLPFKIYGQVVLSSAYMSGGKPTSEGQYIGAATWSNIATVTLNVPPTATVNNFTSDTEGYYANVTTVSVSVSDLTAYYGGDFTTTTSSYAAGVKFEIGSQSNEIHDNGTLSISLDSTGTFTPKVTVTDSRGQTYIETLPQITVLEYRPIANILNLQRINATGEPEDDPDPGKASDEGTNAVVACQFDYPTISNNYMQAPIVKIDGASPTNTVNWYTSWTESGGFSGQVNFSSYNPTRPVTLYGKIIDTLATDTSYEISVACNTTLAPGNYDFKLLPQAFYLLSAPEGGHGLGIGRKVPIEAEGRGLHVGMDTIFYENVIFQKMAGVIQMFAGSTAPSGWLLCDGSEYLKTDYPLLYAVIGDAYGDTTKGAVAPSDSDHFRVPDFRGRTGIGTGNGTATGHTDHTIGKLGGNEDAITPYHAHTVTATQSGVSITGGGHSHKLRVHADTVASGTKYDRPNSWASGQAEGYTSSNVTHTHTLPAHTHTISSAGTNGNATGANMPPYLTINYIIATGRFE